MSTYTTRTGTDGRIYVLEGAKVLLTTRDMYEAGEFVTAMEGQLMELAAELRAEQWFEERGYNDYTGSEQEARDRWMDSYRY